MEFLDVGEDTGKVVERWSNQSGKDHEEHDEETTDLGGGFTHYSSSKSGTAAGTKFAPKATAKGGKMSVSGPEAYAVWGGEVKEGVRGEWTTGDTDYGKGTAKVNANVVASGFLGRVDVAKKKNKGADGSPLRPPRSPCCLNPHTWLLAWALAGPWPGLERGG